MLPGGFDSAVRTSNYTVTSVYVKSLNQRIEVSFKPDTDDNNNRVMHLMTLRNTVDLLL